MTPTDTITPAQIAELRRLHEAATPGPLSCDEEEWGDYVFCVPRGNIPIFESRGTGADLPQAANRSYLVALWNNAPALLAAAERAGEVEALLEKHRAWHSENVNECARLAARLAAAVQFGFGPHVSVQAECAWWTVYRDDRWDENGDPAEIGSYPTLDAAWSAAELAAKAREGGR